MGLLSEVTELFSREWRMDILVCEFVQYVPEVVLFFNSMRIIPRHFISVYVRMIVEVSNLAG